MDKLSLHETFRIYLPGLLFCTIAYALFLDTTKGIGQVLVPSLFIGFALNVPLFIISRNFFTLINDRFTIKLDKLEKTFQQHQHDILSQKHKQFRAKLNDVYLNVEDITSQGFLFSTHALLARNYDSAETSSFRLPKSLGVMCFNFSVISLALPVIYLFLVLVLGWSISVLQTYVCVISTVLSMLFLLSARNFMIQSLIKELHFWGSINFDEFEKLASYYTLQHDIDEIN